MKTLYKTKYQATYYLKHAHDFTLETTYIPLYKKDFYFTAHCPKCNRSYTITEMYFYKYRNTALYPLILKYGVRLRVHSLSNPWKTKTSI